MSLVSVTGYEHIRVPILAEKFLCFDIYSVIAGLGWFLVRRACPRRKLRMVNFQLEGESLLGQLLVRISPARFLVRLFWRETEAISRPGETKARWVDLFM